MQRFHADPDREFTFYLADRLGMTVAELERTMPNAEYVEWSMWHARKAQRREMDQLLARVRGGRG